VGFPGILKGALLVRAKTISDEMTITAARSLAAFAEERGITPDNIIATMDEADVFAREAADVAVQAVKENLHRVELTYEEAFERAVTDIAKTRAMIDHLVAESFIEQPQQSMLQEALEWTVKAVS
jgi:malate dehydrogenase (oxaloacetate-decarboxylating)